MVLALASWQSIQTACRLQGAFWKTLSNTRVMQGCGTPFPSAKWWPFCFSLNVLAHFSIYILHSQWNQVKCHKASFMITQELFAKVHRWQVIYSVWPKICIPVANALEILQSCTEPVIKCRKFWHDFCFPSFIWHPGFDTIVTFASYHFMIWSVPWRTYGIDMHSYRPHEIYLN